MLAEFDGRRGAGDADVGRPQARAGSPCSRWPIGSPNRSASCPCSSARRRWSAHLDQPPPVPPWPAPGWCSSRARPRPSRTQADRRSRRRGHQDGDRGHGRLRPGVVAGVTPFDANRPWRCSSPSMAMTLCRVRRCLSSPRNTWCGPLPWPMRWPVTGRPRSRQDGGRQPDRRRPARRGDPDHRGDEQLRGRLYAGRGIRLAGHRGRTARPAARLRPDRPRPGLAGRSTANCTRAGSILGGATASAAHMAAAARQIGYPDMDSVIMRVMTTRPNPFGSRALTPACRSDRPRWPRSPWP